MIGLKRVQRGEFEDDVLMLLPVTGRSGGKRKSTVVTIT